MCVGWRVRFSKCHTELIAALDSFLALSQSGNPPAKTRMPRSTCIGHAVEQRCLLVDLRCVLSGRWHVLTMAQPCLDGLHCKIVAHTSGARAVCLRLLVLSDYLRIVLPRRAATASVELMHDLLVCWHISHVWMRSGVLMVSCATLPMLASLSWLVCSNLGLSCGIEVLTCSFSFGIQQPALEPGMLVMFVTTSGQEPPQPFPPVTAFKCCHD